MLQEASHMDRITQLQDEIQQLLNIMAQSITYLTTRVNFTQISPEIPVTKKKTKVDPPDVFAQNTTELVTDLVRKAKQIEYLIQSLPEPEAEETQARRLQALESEMTQANEEYAKAVKRARNLHGQVTALLDLVLENPEADVLKA
ncbi:hypothetical protein K523DRAFT_272679 [Schizophyllum commune Tattone D]|nr:hypothetical protein K523DRAFT_272679 [Schizophyllum commune Tattone D]